MTDIYSVIEDIRFRTALLESLEWDEDLLETFLVYFDGEIKTGNDLESFLLDIKEYFGVNTYNIIIDMFKVEIDKIDIYDNEEH
jgi:hypothetical protein